MSHTPTADEIQTWLTSYIADLLEMSAEDVDPTANFDEYGLDSALAVSLTGDMEEWLGCKINPTILYNYSTIASLSSNIASEISNKSAS